MPAVAVALFSLASDRERRSPMRYALLFYIAMVLASLCVNPLAPLLDVFFLGGFPPSTITGGFQNRTGPLGSSVSYVSIFTHKHRTMLLATTMGLEPTTSGVTGRRSHQLNYIAIY